MMMTQAIPNTSVDYRKLLMQDFKLVTPVVFLVFNRPDTTARVFAEIAKAKPPKLFVIADGARPHRHGEAQLVAQTRAVVERVDWPCEVLTHFSDVNLGCKLRVSTGLDWVFEQVEEAIILEDDCLPTASFFQYCQELLTYHRGDLRVGVISGDNFQADASSCVDSYYFSKYIHIWGWATWRDRWVNHYDVGMSRWPKARDERWLSRWSGSQQETNYWTSVFDRVTHGDIDTWDYQWSFANWLNGRLCCIPARNMISNIGFRPDATHTRRNSDVANLPVYDMAFPLRHPAEVVADPLADAVTYKRCFHTPAWRRAMSRLLSRVRGVWPYSGARA